MGGVWWLNGTVCMVAGGVYGDGSVHENGGVHGG